jgi:CRISPR/Cas system-associated exonuclease Cas4 (RecB family)
MSDQAKVAAGDAVKVAVEETVAGKKFWMSKTFWANAIMAGAVLVQTKYGFVVSLEIQALVISGVNLALRKITKEPVTW